jgi:Carboxypeptidase regulatory-like domain/TonB-dependent Receptor Plug Domain
MFRVRVFVVFVIAVTLSSRSFAQSSVHATVSGRVDDPSGGAVPGASVALTNEETGTVQTATTGAAGAYQFPRVVPGQYRLEASLAGFGRALQAVTLAVNDVAVVNLSLPLAAVDATVTVEASLRPVSRSAAVSRVVESREIQELPLNSRDFQRLMVLAPGVVAGTPRGLVYNPSVSGTRSSSNNFTLDGMTINEEDGVGGLGPGGNPGGSALSVPNVISTETLQEFRVVTSNADASFGRGAGAQVNVVTKSGTNALRGSAYEYFRNSRLDARDFFNRGPYFDDDGNPIPPPLKYNLFGASAGGPIARDRHFFFASYEGFRQKEDLISSLTLPNAALMGLIPGDLGRFFRIAYLDSGVVSPAGIPGGEFRGFSAAERASALAAGFPAALFDGTAANDEAGVIVANLSQPREYVQDAALVRTDHRLSDRVTISARYAHTRSRFERYLGRPGSLINTDRDLDSGLGQVVSALSPSQVLEVRGGWYRTDAPVCTLDIIPEFTALGLSERGLSLALTGTTAFTLPFTSTPCTFLQTETVPQASAVHTWTRGGLTWRSGLDMRDVRNDFANHGLGGPTYQFSGLVAPTGLLGSSPAQTQAVATALTATLFGGDGSPTNPQRVYRSLQQEYFTQADWRLSSRVTANLGVRYSIFGVYRFDGASNLYAVDPATGSIVPDISPLSFGRTSNRIERVSDERPLYQSDLNNIQPRLGVAWDITGRSSTVLKAAYGTYHDRFFRFGFANVVGNIPGAVSGSIASAPFTLAPVTAGSINPGAPAIFAIDPSIRSPYFHRTTVGVDQRLGSRTSVFAAYVGTFGRDLARIIGLNFGPGFPQAQRPDPRFAEVNLFTNVSTSRYDALQLQLRSDPVSGVSATVAYTYSRHHDFIFPDTIGANQQIPVMLTNQGASANAGFQVGSFVDRPLDAWAGRSDQSLPHVLSISHIVEIPFGRDRRWGAASPALVDAILGGWSLSGLLQARSGNNVNLLLGTDVNDDGYALDRPALRNGSLDDLYSRSGSGTQYLVPQADALNRLGAPSDVVDPFAQVPYNALRAPFLSTYDVSLQKQVPIGARARLAIELNAFNVFNRVNLGVPNATLSSALFGTITSTMAGFGPRQLQLGGKLTF